MEAKDDVIRNLNGIINSANLKDSTVDGITISCALTVIAGVLLEIRDIMNDMKYDNKGRP